MVYNAEKNFVGSSNPMAWVVKRTKLKSKKSFFWDTLFDTLPLHATTQLALALHVQLTVHVEQELVVL